MRSMSKKKSDDPAPEPAKKDQHRSPYMVRLAEDVFRAMKELAEEENRPMTREVRQALIQYLESKNRWPKGGTST